MLVKDDKVVDLDFDRLYSGSSYWFECMFAANDLHTPKVTLSNDMWSMQINTALNYIKQVNFPAAMNSARLAEQLDENREQQLAKYVIGVVSIFTEDIETATSYFTKIIAQDPSQALAYYYLSLCELKDKKYKESFHNLIKSHELDPSLPLVNANLAIFYSIMKDFKSSSIHAQKALDGNVEIANNLVSLVKFQADYVLKENTSPSAYPFKMEYFEADSIENSFALLDQLPTVNVAHESNLDFAALTIFISADSTYFNKYVLTQMLSVLEVNSDKLNFHIHIINPVEQDIEKVSALMAKFDVGLRVTVETTPDEANLIYLSSVRFCRLFQFVQDYQAGVLAVDADMLFIECPYQFELENSVCILHSKGEPLWQEVSAQVIFIKPNEWSLQFLANVSSGIAKHLVSKENPGRWFLDQVSLYNAYTLSDLQELSDLEPISLYGDLAHEPDSYIWAITNDKDEENEFTYYRDMLEQKVEQKLGLSFNVVADCKYGKMIVNVNDKYIGTALQHTGAWCDHEIQLIAEYIKPGDVVIDAGANYGTFALPLAKLVGAEGRVYAFEPQRLVYQAMCGTLALNSISNVNTYFSALSNNQEDILVPAISYTEENNFGGLSLLASSEGNETGELVQSMTIDSLNLTSLSLIKADVEGMELTVLQGAKETIARLRPMLYLENHERSSTHRELIAYCRALGYRLFWHGPDTDRMMFCIHSASGLPLPALEEI